MQEDDESFEDKEPSFPNQQQLEKSTI